MDQHIDYERIIECMPIPAAIFDAQGCKLIAANDAILLAWHRTPEVMGVELLDFMPELATQPYPRILNHVIKSGRIWVEKNAMVNIIRSGKEEYISTDYSYQPIFGSTGKTTAVLLLGDASNKLSDNLFEGANQKALMNTIQYSEAGICIYRGPDFEIEAINEPMLKLWNGKPKWQIKVLNHVYFNAMPYTCNEHGIVYDYMPLIPDMRGPTGVYVVAKQLR
ncbi:hypothetical protein [Pedobacter sp. MC2016-24]|uniref:hypothetical protein n=1 Tax=Pedobacter sp. MC2016-24 TaxID=2780090 RepID=UPI0018822F94|nr:hypothetical protein [Pedobacter sp. MC2016-24]MBE9599460.1 hypothetical protein [Pedobacter sp. MC2016-24]